MKKRNVNKGDIFNELEIIHEISGRKEHRYFFCRCKCGKEVNVSLSNLVTNAVTRCISCVRASQSTHKMSNTKIYKVWSSMEQRITNPKNKGFVNYGGRGLVLDKEWHHFEPFYRWALDNGYKDGLTIERKNNDRGYYPSNCKFIEFKFQAKNKRTLSMRNISGYVGVSWSKSAKKWEAKSQKKYLGIYNTAFEAAGVREKYILKNNIDTVMNFK